MRLHNCKPIGQIFGLVILLMLFCEYLVYYIVIWQCHWPELASDRNHESKLKAFFIADTHLLGSRLGHWFDKLRREWQMHRGFVTATQLLNPDVTFFLGDLFDEGKWASEQDFTDYVDRFHSLFPYEDKKVVLVGNHDIGFHYDVTDKKRKIFYGAFAQDTSGVHRFTMKNVHFVLIDSMAMHGDNCNFCAPAMKKVETVSNELRCMEDKNNCEFSYSHEYSRPILLQHFPLFRKNDAECHSNDPDDLSERKEKEKPFRPQWDCLSEQSSKLLLEKIEPRLVLSGHTHHGCKNLHTLPNGRKVPEWSVASFSWRNRNNPVIVLATLTQKEFVLNKCYLPQESTVINIYILGSFLIFLYALANRRKIFRRF